MERYHIHLEGKQYLGNDVKQKCCLVNDAIGEASRLHMLLHGDKNVSAWDDIVKHYILEKPGKRATMSLI